jgi:hypothetical protein
MELTRMDHIDVGDGWLHGPPFLARYLLYRLFDCNCSLLVYHSQDESGISSVDTSGNLAVTSNVASSEGPPTSIYVNCDFESALTPISDLLTLSAVRLSLSTSSVTVATFGVVAVRVQWFLLPLTKKLLIAGELSPLVEFDMAKSGYYVTGPIGASSWPASVLSAQKKRPCWRVSVDNVAHQVNYNLQETSDWSLTALHKDGSREPSLIVTLQKGKTKGAGVSRER